MVISELGLANMKFELTFSLVKLSESSMQKCLQEKKYVKKH